MKQRIIVWAKNATIFNWISLFLVPICLAFIVIGILGLFNIGLLHTDERIYVYSMDNPTEAQAIEVRTYLAKYLDINIPDYSYNEHKKEYEMRDVSYTEELNIPFYSLSNIKYNNQWQTAVAIVVPIVPCLFFIAGITYKDNK